MKKVQTQLDRIECLLSAQKPVLTLSELSEYTGLSKSCLYKLTSSRKIPFSCPNGKTLFFDRAIIHEWLLSNPVPTKKEIDTAALNYVTLNPSDVGGRS